MYWANKKVWRLCLAKTSVSMSAFFCVWCLGDYFWVTEGEAVRQHISCSTLIRCEIQALWKVFQECNKPDILQFKKKLFLCNVSLRNQSVLCEEYGRKKEIYVPLLLFGFSCCIGMPFSENQNVFYRIKPWGLATCTFQNHKPKHWKCFN